jgi:3-deoxy-D-manno-octulosonate 8-phosphate phosphatase (KDO 8-P phosphatase)
MENYTEIKGRETIKEEKLKKIKLFIMDVDGVLTDGRIIRSSDGGESKVFDVMDGTGIHLAHLAGIRTAIISGRKSEVTSLQAMELGINEVHQVSGGKEEILDRLMGKFELQEKEIAFVGDDLLDIPLLRRVGWAVAVSNAHTEVKKVCHYVTQRDGGRGAVREAIEMIIKSQGKWKEVVEKFLGEQRKSSLENG